MGVEVSVVVPMYNSEDLIGMCVDSILGSTFQDFEIICVDDGSTDNTVKSLQGRYNDPRIRIIRKRNGGVSSARNVGIDNARGNWIVFVDSDDYISSDYIELLRNGCADSDIAICGYFNVTDGVSKPMEAKDFEGSLEEYCDSCLLSDWSTGVLFSPWNKMFRLDIIRENNLSFNEEISILEDIDFCLRYMKCCNSITSLSDTLYGYCVRGGISSNFNPNWNVAVECLLKDITSYKENCDYEVWKHMCTLSQKMAVIFVMRCVERKKPLATENLEPYIKSMPIIWSECSMLEKWVICILKKYIICGMKKMIVIGCRLYAALRMIKRRIK